MFRDNHANGMAADDLAPSVARSSETIILTMMDIHSLFYTKKNLNYFAISVSMIDRKYKWIIF